MTSHIQILLLTVSVVTAGTLLPESVAAQTSSTTPFARPGADAGAPSLRELVDETVADFRRVPSVESATILSIGAIGAVFGGTFDRDVTTTLSGSRDLGRVMKSGEMLGSAHVQAAAALATYVAGRATGHARTAAIGADLVSAQIVTQAVNGAIKLTVGRDRPDGSEFSFPSGHASTSFATATVLQRHLGWKVGIPAYGLATYVAASRVQVKRHFLSDVTFGAALGIVAGRSVTIGRGDARFAVAPAPVPGGGAVSVTWIGRN